MGFLTLCVFLGTSLADDWNKSTTVEFNEPVRIGDMVLNAGGYVLKLAPLASERHIIQVFSAESGRLILTTIAVAKYRTEVTPNTEFQFWEGIRGQAVALRSWFYPNENYGLELPEPAVGFVGPERPPSGSQPAGGPIERLPREANGQWLRFESSESARGPVVPGPPLSQTHPADLAGRWQQLGGFREKRVIAVGVSHPSDYRLTLQFASKDATDVARALSDPNVGRIQPDPNHIHLLVDAQATRAGIEREILNIGSQASRRDLTLVFMSVHGIEDVSTGRRYLSTFNTNIDNLPDTAFDMASFVTLLESHIAGQIVLITDVCLGSTAQGTTTKGLIVRRGFIDAEMADRTIVLSSSAPNEDSYESPRFQNSFFTHFFLHAVSQLGGFLDLNGIYSYVLRFVPDAVWTESGHSQHPMMYPPHVATRIVIGAPEEK